MISEGVEFQLNLFQLVRVVFFYEFGFSLRGIFSTIGRGFRSPGALSVPFRKKKKDDPYQ